MTYVYPELGPEYEHNSWHADRLMRWCARDLYLPEQPIRWHGEPVEAAPGELWADVVGTARFSTQSEHYRGWADWDRPGIAVVAGQPFLEMLITVGHEMYHRYEMREGRYPLDHQRADAYGERIAQDYLRRAP